MGQIDNKPTLGQIKARRWSGDKLWTNDDLVWWGIYASLSLNELTHMPHAINRIGLGLYFKVIWQLIKLPCVGGIGIMFQGLWLRNPWILKFWIFMILSMDLKEPWNVPGFQILCCNNQRKDGLYIWNIDNIKWFTVIKKRSDDWCPLFVPCLNTWIMIFQIWRSSRHSRLPHRRAHYSTEQVHSDRPVWGQSSKLLPCTYSQLRLPVFSYISFM